MLVLKHSYRGSVKHYRIVPTYCRRHDGDVKSNVARLNEYSKLGAELAISSAQQVSLKGIKSAFLDSLTRLP